MPQNTTDAEFAALFSYAREDDENDGKRLTSLKRHLEAEIRLQTGQDFKIFQDVADTPIGQHWYQKITSVINGSTFLIAIITPSFLNSNMCRDEVSRFIDREQELGRNDLIFPILYAETTTLANEGDGIAKDLNCRQYYPWRELRFEPFDSTQYRSGIADIAGKIIAAIESSKTLSDDLTANVNLDNDDIFDHDPDYELGFIEILAETEDTLPLFVQTIEEFGEKLTDLTAMAESATADMDAANAAGKPASAKLSILYRFAKRLEPTAEDMETLADDYTDQLSQVDLGMKAISEQLIHSKNEENLQAAIDLKSSLDDLVEQGEYGMSSLQSLGDSISNLYKLSSTTRPVLKRISKVIDKIVPSQHNFINWRNGLDDALNTRRK